MHIILLVRYMIAGKLTLDLNSKSLEQYCQKIIDVCSSTNDKVIEIFNKAVDIVNSIEDLTDDRLKRQAIMSEMIAKI